MCIRDRNNIVIFNFEVENLKSEYERIKALNIGEVSEIMYVNVHMLSLIHI